MRVLESILNFLTVLARIIFPRRPRTVAGDNPCPNPLPAPPGVDSPLEGRDGSDPELHRGDTLALGQNNFARDAALHSLHLMGCCLMGAGGIGCLLKHLL